MAAEVFLDTARELNALAQKHTDCLVAFSGGKDSLAVLDLCAKAFTRVVCYHVYFVPGLRVVEDYLDYARTRYGVEILQFPGGTLARSLANGHYCDPVRAAAGVEALGIRELGDLLRHETGTTLVVNGGKFADFINRRQHIEHDAKKFPWLLYPIRRWNKFDVLSYLKTNGIETPASDGRVSGSVNLTTTSLLWLYDQHRADFEQIERYFPYVRAVVYRREWYGVA